MNAYENWFCGSAIWRYVTRRRLLPWLLRDVPLGEHVLELGAGRGSATAELAKRAANVTSLEYDAKALATLKTRVRDSNVQAIQGDAAQLTFPDGSFTSAIAILMLHHLKSPELQDRAFSEIHRVLRPGGVFVAFEIEDSWLHRAGHIKSTFVPVAPRTVAKRLETAGFLASSVDRNRGGFRIRAQRTPQN